MKKLMVLSLMMVLLLIASYGDAADSSRPTKDTVVFAQTADITSLDPHVGRQLSACVVHIQMFDTLVKFSPTRELVPSIAASWKFLSDTELELQIRKGMKFHNGDDLTAEDVAFSITRAVNSPHTGHLFPFIKAAEVTDDYTVVISTKEPYAAFLFALTSPTASIVPKKVVEADEKAFALHPIGSGPYKFVEWKPGESVTLEAFEGYYLGTPPTKTLVMRVIPENAQQAIMLETGEIDIAYAVLANDVSKIESNPDLKTIHELATKSVGLVFNNRSAGPVSNKLVRRAIEYAINKDLIVEKVLYGNGQPGSTIVPPGVVGYDDTLPANRYDVQKAKALLVEAGYPDGFEMRLWVQNDQVYQEVCQVLQSQLQEVGIDVKIEVLEYGTMLSMVYGGSDFDAVLKFFNIDSGDGAHGVYTYSSTNSANTTRYDSPEATALIAENRITLDQEKRKELFGKIYAILEEDKPEISVFYEQIVLAMSKNVEGLEVHKEGYHKYRNVVVYADQ